MSLGKRGKQGPYLQLGSERSNGIKEMQAGETGKRVPLLLCYWTALQFYPDLYCLRLQGSRHGPDSGL